MEAVAVAAGAREADVAFLVKKLAAAEQQLRSVRAEALFHATAAVSSPHPPSLHAAFLHKAVEAERATPSREVACADVDDAVAAETRVLQELLPLLQRSSESFTALHTSICQVTV